MSVGARGAVSQLRLLQACGLQWQAWQGVCSLLCTCPSAAVGTSKGSEVQGHPLPRAADPSDTLTCGIACTSSAAARCKPGCATETPTRLPPPSPRLFCRELHEQCRSSLEQGYLHGLLQHAQASAREAAPAAASGADGGVCLAALRLLGAILSWPFSSGGAVRGVAEAGWQAGEARAGWLCDHEERLLPPHWSPPRQSAFPPAQIAAPNCPVQPAAARRGACLILAGQHSRPPPCGHQLLGLKHSWRKMLGHGWCRWHKPAGGPGMHLIAMPGCVAAAVLPLPTLLDRMPVFCRPNTPTA